MNRIVLAVSAFLLSSTSLYAQQADIFGESKIDELQGQDIDATLRLVEALSRAAKKGPKLRVSPDKIFMKLEEDSIGAETIRISNVGDEDGAVKGINSIGSISGLDVSHNCPEVLSPGGFCDIAVRFEAGSAQSIMSVIVVAIEERDRSSFDIPLQIEVTDTKRREAELEAARKAAEEASAEKEKIVVVAPPPKPQGPTSRDIASSYFNGMGGAYRTPEKGGFIIVSRPDSLKKKTLAGVDYSEVRREVEISDARYPEDIPHTEATLPVNRDNILTADRVIKGVLDTPVSNVMCGKVVAMVESDVYSASGSTPLIPAGSRITGRCGSFADERVGISWDRIITSDGRSISLSDDTARTNDASGLGGGIGRVYRSSFDRFVLPLISTVIDTTAGVIFATFGDNESVVTTPDGNIIEDSSAKNEGLRIVTEQARTTGQELIDEIRDVREVMVLPAGSRIDIEISEDIYFKNSREVIRLADTKYSVEDIDRPEASIEDPGNLVLVPYRHGMTGPVVTVEGEKFVVMEKEEPVVEDEKPINPVISDLTPRKSN